MLDKSKFVLIGKIISAHGIKGIVKIQTYSQNPNDITSYGQIFTENMNPINIRLNKILDNGIVLSEIENVTDRTSAENYRGTNLFVKRENLSNINETDSFYINDLIGLNVFNESNEFIGKVISVQNYGAGDILEIETKGTSKMILFHDNFIKNINLSTQTIVIFNND